MEKAQQIQLCQTRDGLMGFRFSKQETDFCAQSRAGEPMKEIHRDGAFEEPECLFPNVEAKMHGEPHSPKHLYRIIHKAQAV
jgi:hypothetical protein